MLSLAGKLKKSINFSGNPLTLQKKLRDEWQSTGNPPVKYPNH
ncbi:conserved hypothetical protein [Rickettsiella grylli]|uniref:Uncharacterized protein n=1 Tax=Rickettsiella grylli TaxID=59196 RepID=A8PKL9_9COXI|nr:conserved hypothetical protein [Rickettsiella grylli]